MFPFVADIFPEDVIVPLVEILPVDDMSHCNVHTPTPVLCANREPAFVLDQSFSIEIFRTKHTVWLRFKIYGVVITFEEDKITF